MIARIEPALAMTDLCGHVADRNLPEAGSAHIDWSDDRVDIPEHRRRRQHVRHEHRILHGVRHLHQLHLTHACHPQM